MIAGSDIERRVALLVAEITCIAPATIQAGRSLDDEIGADALDRIEIVLGLEAEFDVALDREESDWATPGDIVRSIQRARSS